MPLTIPLVSSGGTQSAPLKSIIGSNSYLQVGTVSSNILGRRDNREGVIIVNDSTETILLGLGSDVSPENFSVKLLPGAYWESPRYQGQIVGMSLGAAATIQISELDATDYESPGFN